MRLGAPPGVLSDPADLPLIQLGSSTFRQFGARTKGKGNSQIFFRPYTVSAQSLENVYYVTSSLVLYSLRAKANSLVVYQRLPRRRRGASKTQQHHTLTVFENAKTLELSSHDQMQITSIKGNNG